MLGFWARLSFWSGLDWAWLQGWATVLGVLGFSVGLGFYVLDMWARLEFFLGCAGMGWARLFFSGLG
jgi:hypothetical protein